MKPDLEDILLSDAQIELIIQQIKEGHKEPFRFLVKQYQRRIHVYCYHMMGNRQEAEDAVQDIFVKCYQHLASYTENISFTAWLYRISYNHCMNLLKKRKARHRVFSLYRMEQQIIVSDKNDYDDLVGDLLSGLSSEERNLILMRVLDERTFEEIGQILGCKPATVRKKYERLKKRLRLRPLWSQR
ncbi:RNA polymerase sigma factor [Paenibacillus segetis]|uniref:ECF RNA polymerase sigma factor SigW n=1 Tax=Paenibacillus segetis TaxID=1325360 RepID=A0ABQ1YCK7_9BACL|nr:RNA polymerase sigma factor [Paenibacillus segetis]GGH19861.1 ECF RNA polymerase sigma factor SigW [Paenibacillus segetis]